MASCSGTVRASAALQPAARWSGSLDLALVAPGSVRPHAAGAPRTGGACLRCPAAPRSTCCYFALRMVEWGRLRCPSAFWRVADVQELPLPLYGESDAVLSSFGARHPAADLAQQAAEELSGATKPAASSRSPRGSRVPARGEMHLSPPSASPRCRTALLHLHRWGVAAGCPLRLGPLLEDLQLRTLEHPAAV